MNRKKKYTIEVVFSTPITVNVEAEDLDDAMALAEYEADLTLSDMLDNKMLCTGDFDCCAQTP